MLTLLSLVVVKVPVCNEASTFANGDGNDANNSLGRSQECQFSQDWMKMAYLDTEQEEVEIEMYS
jgi:hypothetical protein